MHDISRIRNVAVVGAHHAGKTTLVEAILEHCGAISRRGSVADGTTTTDCEPESIGHAQSTCVGFAHATYRETDITLVDTPGFVDFFEETKIALGAVDAAIVVIEADPHKLAQIGAVLELIESRRLPHVFVINKLDRSEADFDATLAALQRDYGRHVVAEQYPIGSGERFAGTIDLATKTATFFTANGTAGGPIPDALIDAVAPLRTQFLEALGDFDDTLLEELLEGLEPPGDEIVNDLCTECSHDQIVPVLVTSAQTARGVAAVVDAIANWLPSPLTTPRDDINGRRIDPRADGPLVAQICKTIVHPQSGKLSVVRIFTGTLVADAELSIAGREGKPLRAGGLFRLQGKRQEPLVSAGPGSIVAIARLDGASTGDTLTQPGTCSVMPCEQRAEPAFAVAIRPKERLDEAKLSAMLERLIDEDPMVRVVRADFTGELLLLGAGETHLLTATERLARKYHLQLEIAPPAVGYRETISNGTDARARYKHQTGGHGQFADVSVRIEPLARGSGIVFEERIVGGAIPRAFFPAVERGVREALASGPNGYPVVDVRVALVDGGFHAVDSSEASFRTAGAMAIRDGLPKCSPIVLEPIARLETMAPRQYTSPIVGLITAKRGQILGFEATERADEERIRALVPQGELARFCTELRTATQGLGRFHTAHERFDPVPPKLLRSLREGQHQPA